MRDHLPKLSARHNAFVIVKHGMKGVLLMRPNITTKPLYQDGERFQVLGGRFESGEIPLQHGDSYLEVQARIAAAREIHEEIGMEIDTTRLQRLRFDPAVEKKIGDMVFFTLAITSEDAPRCKRCTVAPLSEADLPGYAETSMDADPAVFKLQLSHEHSAFTFEKDLEKASDAVLLHGMGVPSFAIQMSNPDKVPKHQMELFTKTIRASDDLKKKLKAQVRKQKREAEAALTEEQKLEEAASKRTIRKMSPMNLIRVQRMLV